MTFETAKKLIELYHENLDKENQNGVYKENADIALYTALEQLNLLENGNQ
jgi:hypothetical protein